MRVRLGVDTKPVVGEVVCIRTERCLSFISAFTDGTAIEDEEEHKSLATPFGTYMGDSI